MPTRLTRPGLELARMLKALREDAGWSTSRAADFIGKHVSTYRKFEGGPDTISKGDLRALLREWDLDDDDELQVMLELCDQAKHPDWTSRLRLPEVMRKLLGFEGLATGIKAYEASFIYGPVQTEAYARAVMQGVAPTATKEQIDKAVALRMERQQRNFATNPAELRLILDEAVIRKLVGGCEVMLEQLTHLTKLTYRCEVRLLPLSTAAHPGMLGSFWVFEFDPAVSSPTVYIENRRMLYLSDTQTVEGAIVDFETLWEAALSWDDSLEVILEVIEELKDD